MTAWKLPRLQLSTPTICEWPSDSFSVDYYVPHPHDRDAPEVPAAPHTVIVFVPGNPGLIEWYLTFFVQLVHRLGPGFAARGVAHAGHSLHPDRVNVAQWRGSRCTVIPWTVEGQSLHKAAYIDLTVQEFRDLAQLHNVPTEPAFIFVCHSVGTFFTQQLLMRRADILARTKLLIGLMPFIRMNAPWEKQIILDALAARPVITIQIHENVSYLLSKLPRSFTDLLMRYHVPDSGARSIAVDLVRHIHFVKNFFALGLDEIRGLPETVNTGPLRLCATALLVAGNDHWSPKWHLDELQSLKERKRLPESVTWVYNPKLRHDFVVDKEQAEVALVFCEKHIRQIYPTSKL